MWVYISVSSVLSQTQLESSKDTKCKMVFDEKMINEEMGRAYFLEISPKEKDLNTLLRGFELWIMF